MATEAETPYLIERDANGTYTPVVDVLIIERRQNAPNRPPFQRLVDRVIASGNTYATGLFNDIYTYASWVAMITDVYGGSETAYLVSHGITVDLRDGWEGDGYIAPDGEPVAGLLPLEE